MTRNMMITVRRQPPSVYWMTTPAPTSAWITSATTTALLQDPSVELSTIIPPYLPSAPTITAAPRPASATITTSAMLRCATWHFRELPAAAQAARICTRTTQPAEPDPTFTRTTQAALEDATMIRIAETHPAIDAMTPTACKWLNTVIKRASKCSNVIFFLTILGATSAMTTPVAAEEPTAVARTALTSGPRHPAEEAPTWAAAVAEATRWSTATTACPRTSTPPIRGRNRPLMTTAGARCPDALIAATTIVRPATKAKVVAEELAECTVPAAPPRIAIADRCRATRERAFHKRQYKTCIPVSYIPI